jgi:DHA2 family multidrug resistance protein
MIAMFVAGWLIGRVELRLLLLFGFIVTAVSLWLMNGYSLEITKYDIIWPGAIQGIGLGLVFVPLSTATFATLTTSMRAQGTAIYSLVRNIGSSIGISLVQTLLVRNTQIVHSSLVENITNSNVAIKDPAIAWAYNLSNPAGLAALNGEVTRQAAMIAYLDDFRLMLALTLLVIPLLLLISPPKKGTLAKTDSIAME